MSVPTARDGRGGFVLGLVVLLLFAISVAGATGYLVVSTEFTLSTQNREGREALAVARAGMQRYLAETVGTVADSVSYAIGDGIATVTTVKVAEEDSLTHLYYIRSEGTILDLRTPDTPAERVVGAYAYHRMRPLAHHAAVMISADRVTVRGGSVTGLDQSTAFDCSGGGTAGTTGVVAVQSVTTGGGGSIDGNPQTETWAGGYSAMYDSVALRWDILSDASFPVDIEQSWSTATFNALPADSFPLVRFNGGTRFGGNDSGRGVLIVTGEFNASGGFQWDGIVLAGSINSRADGQVNGMLIGGLNAANSNVTRFRADVAYYSCNVYSANDALSYLELVEESLFEGS